MKIFLIAISVVSSILMVVVILLQQGKGADLGAAFGRGAQGGLFNSTGKANFLTRITSGLVTVFLLSSLFLSIHLGQENREGVLQDLQGAAVEIPEGDDAVILGSEGKGEAEGEADAGDGGDDLGGSEGAEEGGGVTPD